MSGDDNDDAGDGKGRRPRPVPKPPSEGVNQDDLRPPAQPPPQHEHLVGSIDSARPPGEPTVEYEDVVFDVLRQMDDSLDDTSILQDVLLASHLGLRTFDEFLPRDPPPPPPEKPPGLTSPTKPLEVINQFQTQQDLPIRRTTEIGPNVQRVDDRTGTQVAGSDDSGGGDKKPSARRRPTTQSCDEEPPIELVQEQDQEYPPVARLPSPSHDEDIAHLFPFIRSDFDKFLEERFAGADIDAEGLPLADPTSIQSEQEDDSKEEILRKKRSRSTRSPSPPHEPTNEQTIQQSLLSHEQFRSMKTAEIEHLIRLAGAGQSFLLPTPANSTGGPRHHHNHLVDVPGVATTHSQHPVLPRYAHDSAGTIQSKKNSTRKGMTYNKPRPKETQTSPSSIRRPEYASHREIAISEEANRGLSNSNLRPVQPGTSEPKDEEDETTDRQNEADDNQRKPESHK
jgi:hypothetical protein